MQLDFQRYITKKINKNERRFSFSLEKDFQTYESWRNSPLFKGFIDYLEDNTYSLSLLNRIYKSSKKYFNIISQKVEIISLIDDKNLKTEFLVNLEGLGTQSLPSYLKMIQKGESYAKNLKEIIKAFQESKDPSTFSPEDAVRPFYYLIRYYLFAFKRITALVAIESSQIKMKKNINKNATEINNNSTDTLSIEDQISQMRKFYIKSRLEKVHK